MKHIIFTLSILCLFTKSFTQPGTLDAGFAKGGIIKDSVFVKGDIVVQPDQKILVATSSPINGDFKGGFQLERYLPDGSLDPAFGENGITSLINNQGGINSVALLPDGKIIAGGSYKNMIIAKYLPDGRLDSSFGINGQMNYTFPGIPNAGITRLQLQKDGKILVTGTALFPLSHYGILARFNANGSIDQGFGNGTGFLSLTSIHGGSSLLVQPDNKIIVGGTTLYNYEFATTRYLTNGNLDSSFGKNGFVITSFNEHRQALSDLALQPDGKILASGTSNEDLGHIYSKITVVRYNTDGSIDKTFGNDGTAFAGFRDTSAQGQRIALQPDGKIVLSGTKSNLQSFSIPALIKLTSAGMMDSSFGINGFAFVSFEGYTSTYALALQKDGKILQSGEINTASSGYYNFLARFNNNINQKQVIIAKIRRWVQNHHNGIVWENVPGTKSYTVERSTDNGNWSAVNSHQLTLQSSATANYYEDPTPANGTNYYRVSTTSTDNAVAVSNVLALTNNNTSSNISIYPNPVKDVLNVKGLNVNDTYTIKITNELGNTVLSKSIINNDSYNCNVKNLSKGIYYISFTSNQKTITLKFVKE